MVKKILLYRGRGDELSASSKPVSSCDGNGIPAIADSCPRRKTHPLPHAAHHVVSRAWRLVVAVLHHRPSLELPPSRGCVRCARKGSLQVSARPLGQIPTMRREATPLRRGPHRHHCAGTASGEGRTRLRLHANAWGIVQGSPYKSIPCTL